MYDDRPIGVFDSGVGGLTVVDSIMKAFPHESIIYYADTYNVPYGPKTINEINSLSENIVKFLIRKDVKAIVIACNTICATSLDILKERYEIPIIGVINSGVRAALSSTKNNNIGLLGTKRTINSKVYENKLIDINKDINLYGLKAPVLVTKVEEGLVKEEETKNIVKDYIYHFKDRNIDTLILGCTHYGVLLDLFIQNINQEINIIIPSDEVLLELKMLLEDENLLSLNKKPKYIYYVSGNKLDFISSTKIAFNFKDSKFNIKNIYNIFI